MPSNIKKMKDSNYAEMSYWWGYEFVFSQQAIIMREVIFGSRKYPYVVPLKWASENENRYNGISIL